ncbi:hypothetical protein HYPSUDRAFT_59118 [Hypholoma sublateritium FD-334 SS-4]|uniref:Ricin B lectin domain-containing protein n=1 Tax=Hypholoma sublateritium (strain FD-334 SS-4) TaxID=945553 RepID=A0A0D2P2W7_HYPSF|nr:hypothetical protein HYPSUDRAFT_59118 [Hypholoma sublateritium FD-334 SS-4]
MLTSLAATAGKTSLASRIALGALATGAFTIQSNGSCLNLRGADTNDFTPVIYFPCSGTGNEEWVFTLSAPPSTFTIANAESGSAILAFPTTVAPTNAQSLVIRTDSAVVWDLLSVPGTDLFKIMDTITGNVITAFEGASPGPLQLQPFGVHIQQFDLVAV